MGLIVPIKTTVYSTAVNQAFTKINIIQKIQDNAGNNIKLLNKFKPLEKNCFGLLCPLDTQKNV